MSIVGFRNPIPRVVVRTVLLGFEDSDLLSDLLLRIWYPDMEPGMLDEAGLYILAGWEIHREVEKGAVG